MDTKKIFNKIKEKIAVDNYKIERKKQKKRNMILAGSFLAILLASLVKLNIIGDRENEI